MKSYSLTFIFAVLSLVLANCATASVISEDELNNSSFATAQNLDGFFHWIHLIIITTGFAISCIAIEVVPDFCTTFC